MRGPDCCETDVLHTAPLCSCACTGTCRNLTTSCAPQVSAYMTHMPAKQAPEYLMSFDLLVNARAVSSEAYIIHTAVFHDLLCVHGYMQ